MKTGHLRVNTLPAPTFEWYLDYLAAMDAKDVERYGEFLADDCVMIFNNEEPTAGRRAIVERLTAYWQSFGSIEHDLLNIYGDEHAFTLEALNIYKRLDGKEVTCRAVAFTDRNGDGLVTSVRLYSDVSPVFS